ncbi:unnamed protein product [Fusarium graminearum]|nr:hypothetical protein FG05_08318 [Fusarium graminearum]KAI6753406.1 hypothetical protein HG531_005575 [Fusarium graminearum]PCD20736.1 hypothetical protein FGRA07_04888 [Fusarium graminearum]CAF3459435.1 unnamed protein product [Fusarium graminearum]CAF3486930.1 unnamed protein product [Fusarium graminearum]
MTMDELEEFPMRRVSKTVRFAENLETPPSEPKGLTQGQTKSILRNSDPSVLFDEFGALKRLSQRDQFKDFAEGFKESSDSFEDSVDPFAEFSGVSTFKDVPQENSQVSKLDEVLNQSTGMYATPEQNKLLDVSRFTRTIAGYEYSSYSHSGDRFQVDVEFEKSDTEDIIAEYQDLWLELQFFWDMMLRMQPNCITSNAEYTKQAVDYLLDLSIALHLPDTRPDYEPRAARSQIKCFRRRLRRLELLLRTDMNKCGNSIVMLCGCLVDVQRRKHKSRLWGHLFESPTSSQPIRSKDTVFTARDVARMLKLEDFVTHVWRYVAPQFGPQKADLLFLNMTVDLMDDEIKQYLPTKERPEGSDIRPDWVDVLLHPYFRAAVAREIKDIVDEASILYTKYGTSRHRDGCEAQKTAQACG